jgi:hypothetical protein
MGYRRGNCIITRQSICFNDNRDSALGCNKLALAGPPTGSLVIFILIHPENNETVFDWIRHGRAEKKPGGDRPQAVFVSNLFPSIFETYARVLHRIDARSDDIDTPLSPVENAVLNIASCEPLRSFVQHRRAKSLGNRVRWKELAELLDVPFTPEICGEWFRQKLTDPWCLSRFLRASAPGRKEECAELVSSLTRVTTGSECFFRFSDIPFYAKVRQNEPRLFRGGLNEICTFTKGRNLDFEYWWPPDHCWCVCSDYDLSVTIVAGNEQLTSDLLTSNVLECIQTTAQSRLDPFVPMP